MLLSARRLLTQYYCEKLKSGRNLINDYESLKIVELHYLIIKFNWMSKSIETMPWSKAVFDDLLE